MTHTPREPVSVNSWRVFPITGVLKPSRTKRCEVVPAVFVRGCCLGCSALSPTSIPCSSLGRAQTFQLGHCFGMAPCFLNGFSPRSPSLISVSPIEALCYKFSCFAQGCLTNSMFELLDGIFSFEGQERSILLLPWRQCLLSKGGETWIFFLLMWTLTLSGSVCPLN